MDSLTEEEICSLQGAGTIYQKIKLCYTQCPAFIRKPLDTQNSWAKSTVRRKGDSIGMDSEKMFSDVQTIR